MLERVNCEEKETLLLGDMNCDDLANVSKNPLKHILCSKCKIPTRDTKDSKFLTDIILSNFPQNLPKPIVVESGLSDHHMVGTVREINSLNHRHRLNTCRNFKHYDKEKFIGDLKNVPRGNVYAIDSVNEAHQIFEFYVKGIVDKHDPRIKKKVRGVLCPWRTLEINELTKTRYYHLRKAKESNSE